jgi:hypothetical protein
MTIAGAVHAFIIQRFKTKESGDQKTSRTLKEAPYSDVEAL